MLVFLLFINISYLYLKIQIYFVFPSIYKILGQLLLLFIKNITLLLLFAIYHILFYWTAVHDDLVAALVRGSSVFIFSVCLYICMEEGKKEKSGPV